MCTRRYTGRSSHAVSTSELADIQVIQDPRGSGSGIHQRIISEKIKSGYSRIQQDTDNSRIRAKATAGYRQKSDQGNSES